MSWKKLTPDTGISPKLRLIKLLAGYDDHDLISGNKRLMNYIVNDGFLEAPASTKYHGAYEGGLYDHCEDVALRLIELTENNGLEWERPESPLIIGLFHDLCKVDQYIKVCDDDEYVREDGMLVANAKYHYEYNTNTLLKGHGDKSVMILSQFMSLTEEEMLCIRYHMGAYMTEEWDGFDRAIRKYPNVLFVHLADQLASKVDEV